MTEEDEKRVQEIKTRLEEYEKHKNDPYAYYQEEIKEVRDLRGKAPADIEFLLQLVSASPEDTDDGDIDLDTT